MKKLILMAILMISTFKVNAQGIVTVKDNKSDVPLHQWYVIAEKDFINHSFFYGETGVIMDELKNILNKDDQTIDFPKGTDEEGDDYWVILNENEFVYNIYLIKYEGTEFSSITITTE